MKNISIRDEVYELLLEMKREDESFSDVILRLIEERKNRSLEVFKKYAGSLKESDIFNLVLKERRKFRMREVDL